MARLFTEHKITALLHRIQEQNVSECYKIVQPAEPIERSEYNIFYFP